MGLDKAAFSYILDAGFQEGWDKSTITRGDVNPVGRPRPGARSLDAAGGLGVTLYYLCCTAGDTAIEQIFALVPATLSRYLNFAIPLLLKVLRELPEAQFLWPTPKEMKESSEIIHAQHRKIDGAFGFMDGLNLPCQTSSDALEQNAMYNGWCRAHVVSNIIVFDPKGMIIEAWINAPGSWHDVRVATLGVYDMLIDNTPDGYFVLTDSAFLTNDELLSPKIHTPLKRNTRFPGLSEEEILERWDYSNAVVSARQAVEWGMRAIQGSFARLRMPLSATDKEGRGRLIETCLQLHNVRTSLVGINQIHTVYLPKWTGGQPDFFERLHTTLFPESRGRNPRVQAFQGGPQATIPGAA